MPKLTHENDGLVFNPLQEVTLETKLSAKQYPIHTALCSRTVSRVAQVETSQS